MIANSHRTIFHGSKGGIGATALQLTSINAYLSRGITIKADAGNGANFIHVGLSTVTAGIAAPATDGYKLAAGQEFNFPINNASLIYVIGTAPGLAVSWVGA